MQRILEPELMEDQDQVKAYAEADFSIPHNQFIQLIQQQLGDFQFTGYALDLGCGPGDISCRFATAFPECSVDAIDGSNAMLDYARSLLPPRLNHRVRYCLGRIPNAEIPRPKYAIIFSNSLLHHLPDPQTLWNTVKQYGEKGGYVFVMDLLRPSSVCDARTLVEQYAGDEPGILQKDFYHSLLAAFSLDEINAQLQAAELNFSAEQISDRHVFITGTL